MHCQYPIGAKGGDRVGGSVAWVLEKEWEGSVASLLETPQSFSLYPASKVYRRSFVELVQFKFLLFCVLYCVVCKMVSECNTVTSAADQEIRVISDIVLTPTFTLPASTIVDPTIGENGEERRVDILEEAVFLADLHQGPEINPTGEDLPQVLPDFEDLDAVFCELEGGPSASLTARVTMDNLLPNTFGISQVPEVFEAGINAEVVSDAPVGKSDYFNDTVLDSSSNYVLPSLVNDGDNVKNKTKMFSKLSLSPASKVAQPSEMSALKILLTDNTRLPAQKKKVPEVKVVEVPKAVPTKIIKKKAVAPKRRQVKKAAPSVAKKNKNTNTVAIAAAGGSDAVLKISQRGAKPVDNVAPVAGGSGAVLPATRRLHKEPNSDSDSESEFRAFSQPDDRQLILKFRKRRREVDSEYEAGVAIVRGAEDALRHAEVHLQDIDTNLRRLEEERRRLEGERQLAEENMAYCQSRLREHQSVLENREKKWRLMRHV